MIIMVTAVSSCRGGQCLGCSARVISTAHNRHLADTAHKLSKEMVMGSMGRSVEPGDSLDVAVS